MRGVLVALTVSILVTGTVRADGLIYQLPEDSSWALFKLEGFKDKTKKGGKVENFSGQLKISSVGTATVDGMKCRWIETEQTYRRPDDPTYEERGRVFKVLIPEKHLVRGAVPVDHIQRGWVAGIGKFAGGEPRKIPGTTDGEKGQLEAETRLYLAGPAEDARPLDPEVIESKLGKLKCAGVTGTFETPRPIGGNVQAAPVTFAIRFHEKAPFGVVSFTLTAIEPDGDRVEMKGVLDDFGTTAISRLPASE